MERRLADPAGQGRAVQIQAGTRVDRRLAIQGAVVGVFRDEDMGERAFGRQAALDQPGRRRRLDDAPLASPAGRIGAAR